ncbi:hypothetical protein CDL12_23793 [Handroanthus impetiginosus]|uniref:Uncharacterized protein n=1 Tax=Handroanthus impetiginosus TaxID=429701 RepID=A0A2G9GEN5_9LAMI|nr:hypothetical protein CDL12_23793 [Handroanthus impetiginosus]
MNPSYSVDIDIPNLLRILRKIHKVPPLIRREDRSSGAYDPKVASLGPYHHGKPELQPCEEAKRLALQIFLKGHNHGQEFFQEKVFEVISEARDYYIEGSTDEYTNEEFAEMMLLDSCFLISLIYPSTVNLLEPQRHLDYVPLLLLLGSLAYSSILGHDVFLMENQIPFKILMLLITLRYENGRDSMSKFLQMTAWDKFDEQLHEDIKQRLEDSSPVHLLEALRTILVWEKPQASPLQIAERTARNYTDEKGNVDFLKHEKTFRSAKDLKAKGIFFRPSSSKSFKAINFNSFAFYGKLELPPTYVSGFSKAVFANLIAYEICPNHSFDWSVICYVNFMKKLIDSPADVKELREKRILLTPLTDEDVVRLYKDLNTFEMVTADNDIYEKQKIQQHYDSKTKTWMAQLFYIYFSSPWTVVAWIVGVFVLILTVLQTYFTINPKSDSGR